MNEYQLRKKRRLKKRRYRQNRRANREVERRVDLYVMIDGNETHYPYAYCKYHKGYLTKSMAARHGCETRGCIQFCQDIDMFY